MGVFGKDTEVVSCRNFHLHQGEARFRPHYTLLFLGFSLGAVKTLGNK